MEKIQEEPVALFTFGIAGVRKKTLRRLELKILEHLSEFASKEIAGNLIPLEAPDEPEDAKICVFRQKGEFVLQTECKVRKA